MDLAVLRTPRLLLRQWRDEDRAPFAAMNADPRVMEHFPALMTREQSDAFVDRLDALHASHGFTLWAVQVLDSERGTAPFAGFTGLMPPTFDPPFAHADPCVEVGWRLAPPWWGLGLASEAGRASLDHAFDVLGLDEVVSFTVVANERSWRVMERIGMRRDGEFDHPRAGPDDTWRRHVLYRAGRP